MDIPKKNVQLRELKYYKKLGDMRNRIEKIKFIIEKIKQQNIIFTNTISEEIILSDVLEYTSRNDELSEEGIYNRSINLSGAKKIISVISGQTEDIYGNVPYDVNLHYLSEKPCLQVVTRGINAGNINFLDKGLYATNTNAMLLSIKESKKEELKIDCIEKENIFLKYLQLYLQPIFYEYSSSSEHAVFPLTETINKISIPTFIYSEEMKKVIVKYDLLNDYWLICIKALNRIDELFSKELVI